MINWGANAVEGSLNGTSSRHWRHFFKARDPKALAAWYHEHLGVPVEPDQTHAALVSAGAGEQTVWSTFPADTKYFGPGSAGLMINYRVGNLDAMLAQTAGGRHIGRGQGGGLRLRPLRLGDRPRGQPV